MPRTTGPPPPPVPFPASVREQRPRDRRPRHTWPEVPGADDFKAFEEAGDRHNPMLAKHLRAIHAAGNTRNPMRRYEAFRGRKPSTRALLESRDLIDA